MKKKIIGLLIAIGVIASICLVLAAKKISYGIHPLGTCFVVRVNESPPVYKIVGKSVVDQRYSAVVVKEGIYSNEATDWQDTVAKIGQSSEFQYWWFEYLEAKQIVACPNP